MHKSSAIKVNIALSNRSVNAINRDRSRAIRKESVPYEQRESDNLKNLPNLYIYAIEKE